MDIAVKPFPDLIWYDFRLTLVLGTEVDILASKFTECLNTAAVRIFYQGQDT